MEDLLKSIQNWDSKDNSKFAFAILSDFTRVGVFADVGKSPDDFADALITTLVSNPLKFNEVLYRLLLVFGDEDFRNLIINVHESNQKSLDILHNLGFKVEGE